MKITGCVITKDEEINIEKCLKSLKPFVSEMIVVDTGSTDNTVQLSENLGAKVYHFNWVNDFSKAKNFAVSKASGDWIISIDADEYLDEQSIKSVKACISKAVKEGADGILSNLINYESDTETIQSTIPKIKIFKKDPKIRFWGAIHETLKHSDKNMKVSDCKNDITFIHVGYSNREIQRKEKGQRNLYMLLEELRKKPNNYDLNFYLSETYGLISEYELALFYALKANEKVENSDLRGTKEKNYFNILRYMKNLQYTNEELEKVFKEANRMFPSYPDFYVYLGDSYRFNKQTEDAIIMYERAIELMNDGDLSRGESQVTGVLVPVYKELANLYYKVSNNRKAVSTLSLILNTERYDFISLKKLMEILITNGEQEEEIINFFEKIYNTYEKSDLVYLLKASLINGSFTLSDHYMKLLRLSSIDLKEEEVELEFINKNYSYVSMEFLQMADEGQNQNHLLIKSIAASLLSNDKVIRDQVFQKVNHKLGIDINRTINKNEELSHEEFDIFLGIVKEYYRLSKYQQIENIISEVNDNNLLLATADLFYKNKNFNLALQHFDQYLQKNSEIEEANLKGILIGMSDCLYQIGEIETAQSYIENAYSLKYDDYRIYSIWIKIATKLRNNNKLKEVAQKAFNTFPESKYFVSVLESLNIDTSNSDDNIEKDVLKDILYSDQFFNLLYGKLLELKDDSKHQEAEPVFEFLNKSGYLSSQDAPYTNDNCVENEEKQNKITYKNHLIKSPIFIGGAGRSGTTLLRVMLNAHPNLCSGPEFKMLPQIANMYNQMVEMKDVMTSYGVNNDDLNASYANFISSFFEKFIQEKGANRIVEKTPHNVLIMKELIKIFPDAKFINVIRDGRDVATSLVTMDWFDFQGNPLPYVQSIEKATEYWRSVVIQSIQASKDPLLLGKVKTIKYEDLIAEPKKTMKDILEFLGEDWSEQVLEFNKVDRGFEPNESSTNQVSKQIYTKSKKRWETDFTLKDKEDFKNIGGQLLIDLKYEDDIDW